MTKRLFMIALIAVLAIAGSAYAQTDTSSTAAAQGTYPPGTSFNGVPLDGLQISSGVIIGSGGTADGKLGIRLIGPTTPLGTQIIIIEAEASGGSRAALNVVTITGTCTIDMGDGTPPTPGVPIVATITTNDQSQGSVGLTLGTTALPAATINAGSMNISDLPQQ